MDKSVTGVLSVELTEDETALVFRFDRSADGDKWTGDRIRALLDERGLASLVSDEAIDTFLESAERATGEIGIAVKEGIPPIAPKAESVSWEALDIPPDLTGVAEVVFAKAPKPDINRTIQDRVTKTKEVKKKPKGPFGKPRIETVEYAETVTRKERVYVSPDVVQRGYATAGTVIGSVQPQEPGVPGKSVRGTTVPAKQLADPHFYHGTNVERREANMVASETGFVRIGKNWVDLVRFAKHEWSVRLSEDRATALLDMRVGSPEAPVPEGGEILTAVAELEYPDDSLLDAAEVDEVIAEAVRNGTDLKGHSLSTSRDSSFDIDVPEDKLVAYLNLHKGKGRGRRLNLKEVGSAIKNSGIKGLNFDKIKSDITEFFQGPEFDLTGYVLAEGTSATPGPDRDIKVEITYGPENKTREMVARLRNEVSERVDPDAPESFDVFPPEVIQKSAMVHQESLVISIEPETPGENGVDVYGVQIVAPPGKLPPFELYENLERKETIIVAACDGVLDYADIDGTLHFRVRPQVEAVATVDVAEDKREARITLIDGKGGGTRIGRDMVDSALADAGVTFGIDRDALEKVIAAASSGTEVRGIPIARAEEPIHQQDHQVEWLVELAKNTGVRIRKDGSADYRTRNTITSVKAGQQICRVLPSKTKAKDGTDVTGNAIPATTDTGIPIEHGEGVTRTDEEDGGTLFTAENAGELLAEKNRIEIRTVHVVAGDVDMGVGNIKFSGSVEIAGTVKSGFYVVSGGDISVAGAVEAALLSADGDITVNLGVKGAGKAILRSKKRVMTAFAELATVMTVGDMILKSALVRCRVKCNGALRFQGDQGRIVGGTVRSRNGFSVRSIGTERGIKTQISFGQDYLISDLIEKEEKEIGKVKNRIGQVDREMRTKQREGNSGALEKFRAEKVNLLKLLEKRGLRLFTLRERFEEHYPSKVVVTETVHAGTVFESHGRTHEITADRKGILVEFDPRNGIITVKDLKEAS